MSKLLRYYSENSTYFVTTVTHNRSPILVTHFDILWDAVAKYSNHLQFDIIAWVVMPDHAHLIITPQAADLSRIIHSIKSSFASRYRKLHGMYRGRVWQNRFWDHVIRDEVDLRRHIDYIHYNPVKHGLTRGPVDWQRSSFHQYYEDGIYSSDWGHVDPAIPDGDYGE